VGGWFMISSYSFAGEETILRCGPLSAGRQQLQLNSAIASCTRHLVAQRWNYHKLINYTIICAKNWFNSYQRCDKNGDAAPMIIFING
jgi:hypothetical protein